MPAPLLAALLALAPMAPSQTVTVARVGSALDDATVIGRRRVGLLCLPSPPLRWSDVATGGATGQRVIVQDALEDSGVPVTPLGATRGGVPRLRGTVRAIGVSLCARNGPTGPRARYDGEAALRIEWRLEGFADPGGPAIHTSAIARRIARGEAAPLGIIYRTLLADAARDAARWLLARPRENP